MHKLYEQNALKPQDERPIVLRHKERLAVHDMDLWTTSFWQPPAWRSTTAGPRRESGSSASLPSS